MVLEARENAEKVWYPVVWEIIKDASNVIDYDIHDEITIDSSSVFNANNDTTTGMANVIPWVNAPKLIESTSIYRNVFNWTWSASISWGANLDIPWYDTQSWICIITLDAQEWPYDFYLTDFYIWPVLYEQRWLYIPVSWAYNIAITHYWWPYWIQETFSVCKNDINNVVYTSTATWNIDINASQWDIIFFEYKVTNSDQYWTWYHAHFDAKITKR